VLIVTHQKRTMEIAGMMYGISLNRDGTTKVVGQRLDQTTSIESDARLEGEVTTEVPEADDVTDEVSPAPLDVPEAEPVG
jgi:hypothetical protein